MVRDEVTLAARLLAAWLPFLALGCASEVPAVDAGAVEAGAPTDDAGDGLDAAMRDAGVRDAGWDAGLNDDFDAAPPPRCQAYVDSDGDGFGNPAAPVEHACGVLPAGAVDNDGDCNDAEPGAFPGADGTHVEPMADGSWDWDCDGVITQRSDRWADCGSAAPGSEGWLRLCLEASAGGCRVWGRDAIPSCGELAELTRDGQCSVRNMRYQSCR